MVYVSSGRKEFNHSVPEKLVRNWLVLEQCHYLGSHFPFKCSQLNHVSLEQNGRDSLKHLFVLVLVQQDINWLYSFIFSCCKWILLCVETGCTALVDMKTRRRRSDINLTNYQIAVWLTIGRLFCIMAWKLTDTRLDPNTTLLWRHNGRGSVSNHQPHDCLLNRFFRRRSKKTSKLRVTGLCAGNSPGTGEFPAQMTSNAGNDSIWWRHHETF